jgi:hypothetical protein
MHENVTKNIDFNLKNILNHFLSWDENKTIAYEPNESWYKLNNVSIVNFYVKYTINFKKSIVQIMNVFCYIKL